MLESGSLVFVLFPDKASEKVLRRGVVVESEDHTAVVEFIERIRPDIGSTVRVYHNRSQRFARVQATVMAFLCAEPRPRIRFGLTTESEPAENRQSFRVSVVGAGLLADIDDQSGCALIDVSADGIGIIASTPSKVGHVVRATLTYDGRKFAGRVCIRSICERDDGRYRYGCEALEGEHELRKGIQHINVSVQREQLRRSRGR